MQKDFLHVLPVEEVISRLLDVSPLPQESKRLDKLSGGPILAETIMATETLPPANRSGMDGYAVQASDLFGASEANPVWLDCVGEIAIDRPPNFTLQSGQCAAIRDGMATFPKERMPSLWSSIPSRSALASLKCAVPSPQANMSCKKGMMLKKVPPP